MRALFSTLILFLFLISSCKKNNDNPDDQPGGGDSVNVYLAGSDKTGDGSTPCFWKNEIKTILPNSNGGDAYSIAIDGSNVYVAGRHWVNNAQTRYTPCYWLNGNRTNLPLLDERGNGIARSILSFNGTMYAVGVCSDSLEFFANSGWRNLPSYWKNGNHIKLKLLNGFGNGSASSIALLAAPNRVVTYIAGTSYASSGYDEPCYWKLDPATITTPDAEHDAVALSTKGYDGAALSVTSGNPNLAQGDIYIAGFVDNADGVNIPCYWHNGTRTELSKINPNDHGAATAIDYVGNDVYVAGYTNNNTSARVPCLWKNGVRTDLTLPSGVNRGEATSVRIDGADVYVGGNVSGSGGEFPCFWKNGTVVKYNAQGSVSAIALRKN